VLPIDPSCLGKDFSNKINIIEDIKDIIEKLPEGDEKFSELLETKFQ
jgi:hypothetical protein